MLILWYSALADSGRSYTGKTARAVGERRWVEPSRLNSQKFLLAKIHKEGNHIAEFVLRRSNPWVMELYCMDYWATVRRVCSIYIQSSSYYWSFLLLDQGTRALCSGCWPRVFFDIVLYNLAFNSIFSSQDIERSSGIEWALACTIDDQRCVLWVHLIFAMRSIDTVSSHPHCSRIQRMVN